MAWLKKHHSYILIGLGVAVLVVLGFIITRSNYALRVGDKTATEEVVLSEAERLAFFFSQSEQDLDQALVEDSATQRLIDKYIVAIYAEENEIIVTDQEIEDYYQENVADYDSEEALLAEIEGLWGIDKETYLEELTYDLVRDKVVADIDMDYGEWLAEQREVVDIDIRD